MIIQRKNSDENFKFFSARTLQASSNANTEGKTRVDVLVKDPEVILPEDQHNTNSHSLLLDVSLVNSTTKNKWLEFLLSLANAND